MGDRPSIPEDIKRNVRKKCFFGCVICGAPVYQYDHIIEFSIVNSHDEDNLVLLCPNHHQDKTSGRIGEKVIRKHLGSPYNSMESFTSKYKFFHVGNVAKFKIGGNDYLIEESSGIRQFNAVIIGSKKIFSFNFEDGVIYYNLELTDLNGEILLKIVNSELMVSSGVWDCTMEGGTLKINSEHRKISCIVKISENEINIVRGKFVYGATILDISEKGYNFNTGGLSLRMNGCNSVNCNNGIVVG